MEVKLEKRYPLTVDAARAWRVLRDVKSTAECMPGASITEQIDATHYKGAVKVKVGPANAAFAGDIEVLALDEATRKLQLLGKGADRGGSSASMDLTATVEAGELPDTSVLVGNAAVIVNGKFAQFGGRLMVQVSDMLLAQFADNFRAAAAALPPETSAAVQTATPTPVVAAVDGPKAIPSATPAAPEPMKVTPLPPPTAPVPAKTPANASATPSANTHAKDKPNEINGLSIAWQLLRSWFAGLFGKRPA